ncbi:MAG: intermembrane transport protein PqiB [Desulfobacterales bacterium]
MTDKDTAGKQGQGSLPEVSVNRRRSISVVWLIPLVAALVGAWLSYRAIQEKGPTITISFQSAEGLEAGKTTIRYKNVEIGQVGAIHLSEDLSRVIVTAEMSPDSEDYLTENTRFWVVRARLAFGEVTGLGTLFSGAYISIEPGKGGEPRRRFQGLESPPVVTADSPGSQFRLRAEELGSLDVGAPVYFRRIRVGQVENYELREDGKSIDVQVFIQSPYDRLVRKNTRFYNAAGFDVVVGVDGIRVDTESLTSILLGGLAFETPTNLEPGGAADKEDVFDLYPNRESISTPRYSRKSYFVMYFEESVRGLSVGAPVEFRGIRLGEVVDIRLEIDPEKKAPRIPVLVEIEPDRISMDHDLDLEQTRFRDRLVRMGLRAQMRTGSLLTGQQFIYLDFFPDAAPTMANSNGPYPEIPTVPTPIGSLTASVSSLLERIDKLPMDEIAEKLRSAADGVDRLVNSGDLQKAVNSLEVTLAAVQNLVRNMDEQVGPEVGRTLLQIRQTLAGMERLMQPESPLQQEFARAAGEMAEAARTVRNLADFLERHPEALIQGKDKSGL